MQFEWKQLLFALVGNVCSLLRFIVYTINVHMSSAILLSSEELQAFIRWSKVWIAKEGPVKDTETWHLQDSDTLLNLTIPCSDRLPLRAVVIATTLPARHLWTLWPEAEKGRSKADSHHRNLGEEKNQQGRSPVSPPHRSPASDSGSRCSLSQWKTLARPTKHNSIQTVRWRSKRLNELQPNSLQYWPMCADRCQGHWKRGSQSRLTGAGWTGIH